MDVPTVHPNYIENLPVQTTRLVAPARQLLLEECLAFLVSGSDPTVAQNEATEKVVV